MADKLAYYAGVAEPIGDMAQANHFKHGAQAMLASINKLDEI